MIHPFNRWPIAPTDPANMAAKLPLMVLDPHRRMLFTQRLAVLIQRLRAVGAKPAREEADDGA